MTKIYSDEPVLLLESLLLTLDRKFLQVKVLLHHQLLATAIIMEEDINILNK